MEPEGIHTLSNQRRKLIIAAILSAIIIGATTIAVISWDDMLRHQIPDNWVQIRGPSETGLAWSHIRGVWAGYNGQHLFLKVEWNTTMEDAPDNTSTDISGNEINAYYGTRGVEATLLLGGVEAFVEIQQFKNGYSTRTRGVQAFPRLPLVSNETTKELIIEIPLLPIGVAQSWLDFIQWQEVTTFFEIVSIASAEHALTLPQNSSHVITADGKKGDWQGIPDLTITTGIIPTENDFGAITNISAIFYSDGLAFMMSTHNPLIEILTAFPTMDLEAVFFMGTEAFQEEPIFIEESYNPNLFWTCTDGEVNRSNIVYHLWDSPNPSVLYEEETFELDNNQWNISTVAELTLYNHQIQPLLNLTPTDYYHVHYSIILRYWEN